MRRSVRFTVGAGVGVSILLVAAEVGAQYRYADGNGVSKVVQYKLDVPADYRDAAIWIGPTGVGRPALSDAARETKRRDEVHRGTAAQQDAYKAQEAAELERQRLWRQRR
jgi:hypothetical protein